MNPLKKIIALRLRSKEALPKGSYFLSGQETFFLISRPSKASFQPESREEHIKRQVVERLMRLPVPKEIIADCAEYLTTIVLRYGKVESGKGSHSNWVIPFQLFPRLKLYYSTEGDYASDCKKCFERLAPLLGLPVENEKEEKKESKVTSARSRVPASNLPDSQLLMDDMEAFIRLNWNKKEMTRDTLFNNWLRDQSNAVKRSAKDSRLEECFGRLVSEIGREKESAEAHLNTVRLAGEAARNQQDLRFAQFETRVSAVHWSGAPIFTRSGVLHEDAVQFFRKIPKFLDSKACQSHFDAAFAEIETLKSELKLEKGDSPGVRVIKEGVRDSLQQLGRCLTFASKIQAIKCEVEKTPVRKIHNILAPLKSPYDYMRGQPSSAIYECIVVSIERLRRDCIYAILKDAQNEADETIVPKIPSRSLKVMAGMIGASTDERGRHLHVAPSQFDPPIVDKIQRDRFLRSLHFWSLHDKELWPIHDFCKDVLFAEPPKQPSILSRIDDACMAASANPVVLFPLLFASYQPIGYLIMCVNFEDNHPNDGMSACAPYVNHKKVMALASGLFMGFILYMMFNMLFRRSEFAARSQTR